MKSMTNVLRSLHRGLSTNSTQEKFLTRISSHFDLTQKELDLQSRARAFCEDEIIPTAERYDACTQYPWEILEKAFQSGIVRFSKQGPEGVLEEAIVGEEIATGCSSVFSTIATTNTAASVLETFGSVDIHKRYIALLQGQPLALAYCISNKHLTAEKHGSHFLLKSPPTFVSNAGYASFYLVVGRTSDDPKCPPQDAFTGFVVDKHWLGVNVGQRLQTNGHRCCDTRALSFENVSIPAENIIGQEGGGHKLMKAISNRQTLMEAVGCLGISRRATLSLLQHGCPVDNPVLLRMLTRLDSARLLIRKAAVGMDRGKDSEITAKMAQIQAVEGATNNSIQAIQSLGRDSDSATLTKLIRDASMYADSAK